MPATFQNAIVTDFADSAFVGKRAFSTFQNFQNLSNRSKSGQVTPVSVRRNSKRRSRPPLNPAAPWRCLGRLDEHETTAVRESIKLASRGNQAVHCASKTDEMPPHVPPHSGTELPRSSRETPATFGGARLVLSGRPATFDHPRTWSAERAFERANFRPNATNTDGESLRTARPVPSGQKTEIHPSRGSIAYRLSRGPLAPRTAATGTRRHSRAPSDEVGRNLGV